MTLGNAAAAIQSWFIVAPVAFSPVIVLCLADAIGWLPSPSSSGVPVTTQGITTGHRFSVLPPLQHGQQEFYTVTPLQGTAG